MFTKISIIVIGIIAVNDREQTHVGLRPNEIRDRRYGLPNATTAEYGFYSLLKLSNYNGV